MKVPVLMLCEAAEVLDDGRVSVTGGAPEFWWVPQVPFVGSLPVVIVASLDGDDDPARIGLGVTVVRGEDEAVVGGLREAQIQLSRDPDKWMDGSAVHVPIVSYLDVTFDRVGSHFIVVRDVAGDVVSSALFGVRLQFD